jgi:PAS domain S-box-containing protein
MTLRSKTLIIVSATTFSLILILYGASQGILMGSFTRLEKQFARQNIERAMAALSNEIATLDWFAHNLAAWDDTYAFVQSLSDEYVQSNLMDEALINKQLSLILFVDADDQIVFGRAYDLHNERQLPVPQSLRAHLSKRAPLLRHGDAESHVAGILLLPEGPLTVASRPILTSAKEGPIRGTLIVGRYLDDVELERLSETTYLSLALRRYDDAQMPSDFQAARSFFLDADSDAETSFFVLARSSESIAGYGLLENIYGEPCLILKANTSREIYNQGRSSALYFISALVVVSLVFGMMTLTLLEVVILSRLTRLDADVSQIGDSGDPSARVPVAGGDELSSLAGTINEMLVALESSRDALRKSEERYRLLFNSGDDMIFVADMATGHPGRMIEANDLMCRKLGYTREELGQLTPVDIMTVEQEGDTHAIVEQLQGGQKMLFEMLAVSKDGGKTPVEISAHSFDLGGRPAVLAIARDITVRKQVEEILKQRNRELTILYEAATAINSNLSLEIVLYTVAEQVTRALDSNGCALSLWRREEDLVETLVDYSRAWPDETDAPGTTYDLNDYPLTRRVLETGCSIVIQRDDPQTDAAELYLMKKYEAYTVLMLPLIARDRVVGLVELVNDVKPRDYVPDEVRLAESLVAHAAVAIENARLYERAQQEIVERQQAEAALQKSAQRFHDVAHTTGDWIWEMDAAGQYTYVGPVVEQVLGYTPAEVVGRHYGDFFHPDEREELVAQSRRALHARRAITRIATPNVHKDGHEVILETTGLPMLDAEGNLLGYRGAHRDVTDERLLRERLSTVYALGRELVLCVDEREITRVVTDAVRLLSQCQLCDLWLLKRDNGNDVLVRQAISVVGQTQVKAIATLPLHDEPGIVAATAQAQTITYLPDVREDPRYIDTGLGSRSELCIPLKVGDRVIGVLNAESTELDAFDQEEQQLFAALADQAALAIENARLYEQMRLGRDRLQALSRRLVEVQEAQRRHLARELHDEIGQLLTGLQLNLEMSKRLPASKVKDSLNQAQELVNELVAEVRDLSLDLRPTMLDDLGLLPALLWHFERYTSQTAVRVDFRHSGVERRRFGHAIETAAYRIAQEALTNTARYAGVREVTVRLWADRDILGIQIRDQGSGFDPQTALNAGTTGGLSGMHERAVLLGGRLTIDSAPRKGACLTAEFPLMASPAPSDGMDQALPQDTDDVQER